MALELTSSAFKNNGYIPQKYTGEGPDVSPALAWSNPPQGTKSFALICDDPDAPVGDWVHWVIYNIPAGVNALAENVPQDKVLKDGLTQGKNDFRRIGYNGPMPPPGKPHRYFFKLYALDAEFKLAPGLLKKELLKLMESHVLEEAQLLGMYRR
ncbi:MAG: YbhB/YbcL family Raf kinase inhibitor-like protein [Candidatus Omnitrophica bacterium]|nr:YbhB/YbcL family Raf kinase inhibitor-like protein [Candidatus Omnitrophota bacterium]MBU4477824.1 YbhB/YbcL family Raf kinase inhibitor-like protein [Candidatus Omnitrophota bacterium]MCG2703463.1 YbhB/YbcL family Raf kinase inhibitor-like protein [Candidatus Omnitrophota bacterium]